MRRLALVLCMVGLVALGAAPPPGAASPGLRSASEGRAFWLRHGYLVPHPLQYLRAKDAAAARAGLPRGSLAGGRGPVTGPSVPGLTEGDVTPPDPTGAIGPNGYVELINLQMGIFDRTGVLIASAPIESVVGGNHFHYSDPQVLWDPATQRFYFEIWDTTSATFRWGFSKDADPRTLDPSSWCSYVSGFGYSTLDAPDYPKLGQTKDFLLMGVNFFPDFASWGGGDILWIDKPQGTGPVTTCPTNTFRTGRFTGIHNPDGSMLFTPVPAQQADPSGNGWILAQSDTADPRGGFEYLSLISVRKDPTTGEPLLSPVRTLPVQRFTTPAPAVQCPGSGFDLDTLDGRLERAVSAIDPHVGAQVVWTAMAVFGGGGSEERWFEIRPGGAGGPGIVQHGVVTDPGRFVWNGAISPDRTVTGGGRAHGSAMVMGFTTSSSTQCADVEMVSKADAAPQTAPIVVEAPGVSMDDFSCTGNLCRWGDYGGASPDPGASLAARVGAVWLAQDVPDPSGAQQDTWVWEARP
jgi:hypothetical protein